VCFRLGDVTEESAVCSRAFSESERSRGLRVVHSGARSGRSGSDVDLAASFGLRVVRLRIPRFFRCSASPDVSKGDCGDVLPCSFGSGSDVDLAASFER
jgi:hypothetical protein